MLKTDLAGTVSRHPSRNPFHALSTASGQMLAVYSRISPSEKRHSQRMEMTLNTAPFLPRKFLYIIVFSKFPLYFFPQLSFMIFLDHKSLYQFAVLVSILQRNEPIISNYLSVNHLSYLSIYLLLSTCYLSSDTYF